MLKLLLQIYLKHTMFFCLFFFTLKWHFQDSLICNGENGTPGIDVAHLAELVEDYLNLVACPAPSCENTPHSQQHCIHQHQHLLPDCKKLASSQVEYVRNGRGTKDTKEEKKSSQARDWMEVYSCEGAGQATIAI